MLSKKKTKTITTKETNKGESPAPCYLPLLSWFMTATYSEFANVKHLLECVCVCVWLYFPARVIPIRASDKANARWDCSAFFALCHRVQTRCRGGSWPLLGVGVFCWMNGCLLPRFLEDWVAGKARVFSIQLHSAAHSIELKHGGAILFSVPLISHQGYATKRERTLIN